MTREEIEYLKAIKEAARVKKREIRTHFSEGLSNLETNVPVTDKERNVNKTLPTESSRHHGLPADYRPSEAELKKYLKKWDTLDDYVEHEKALSMIFREDSQFCNNTDIRNIIIKCSTLNDFYATNIYRIAPVARKIYEINDFDKRLLQGDDSLVEEIALVDNRRNYSFATKYCSHHQPDLYPIYDRYVADVLDELRKRNPTVFSFKNKKALTSYPTFRKAIDEFSTFYNLTGYSYKDVDRYIWQLGKDYYNPYENKN